MTHDNTERSIGLVATVKDSLTVDLDINWFVIA
jgi:hypothetical protein